MGFFFFTWENLSTSVHHIVSGVRVALVVAAEQSCSAGNPVGAFQTTANLKGGASSGHVYQKKEKPIPISSPVLSLSGGGEGVQGCGAWELPATGCQPGWEADKKVGWTSVLIKNDIGARHQALSRGDVLLTLTLSSPAGLTLTRCSVLLCFLSLKAAAP